MLIARTRQDLLAARTELHATGKPLALVPTMGALHAGHVSLIEHALGRGCTVAASIFVNPLQFENAGDLARYPRHEAADLQTLHAAGCSLAWLPDAATMYPPDDATLIDVAGPALGWEADIRPGHFRGVATVVAKLFGQLQPACAIFGEKDFQQLQVVARMVRDLALPVQVIGAPTLREPDGLAMSSRNRFLSAHERARAPQLHAALQDARRALATATPAAAALHAGRTALADAGLVTDYIALVDGPSLRPIETPQSGARLIAAARLGSVRLLDNIPA